MRAGAVYKYDLSVPVEKLYDLVEEMRCRLGKEKKQTNVANKLSCSPLIVSSTLHILLSFVSNLLSVVSQSCVLKHDYVVYFES